MYLGWKQEAYTSNDYWHIAYAHDIHACTITYSKKLTLAHESYKYGHTDLSSGHEVDHRSQRV